MPPAPLRSRPRTRGARRRARRPGAVVLLLVVVAAVLGGCGLRLETEPPQPLVPGEVERARQRATADAVALQLLAGVGPRDAAEPVAGALARVADASGDHLEALGGVYEPGTASPDAGSLPSAAPTPTTQPTASAEEVLGVLVDAAARARADAEAVDDGPLGRLLASVAVSRQLMAEDIAAAAGLAVVVPQLSAVESLPAGVGPTDAVVVISSEDAVGMAWEVVAARTAPEARAPVAERAEHHRRRAAQWAAAAGLTDPGIDPRRPAYDLPDPIVAGTDPAAVTSALAELEGSLARTYATLVAQAPPGGRAPLVDALLDAARAAHGLTGGPAVFPGLAEQTA